MRRWLAVIVTAGLVVSCISGASDDSTSSAASADTVVSSTTIELDAPTTTRAESTTTASTEVVAAETLVLAEGVSDWWLAAESDSEGIPVVAYATLDGSIRVLRCLDVDCELGVEEMEIGYFGDPLEFGLAVLADGSPVVVAQSWDMDVATVHTCLDPSCSEFSVVELGDPEPCVWGDGTPCDMTVNFPQIAVGPDGLVRVVYIHPGAPVARVRMATCQDRACSDWEWSTVAQLPAETGTGAPSFRVDDQGQAIIAYWWDQGYDVPGAAVTVCGDALCASDPTVVLEVDGGLLPKITDGPDDSYYVWYRTGAVGIPPELATQEAMEQGPSAFPAIYSDYSDMMVAICSSGGCGEPQYVPGGEDWLLPFSVNLHVFSNTEDSTGAFFHASSLDEPTPQLHFTSCADAECTASETHALGIGLDERYYRIDIITTEGRPPKVLYPANGELHLYTCPDNSCGTH